MSTSLNTCRWTNSPCSKTTGSWTLKGFGQWTLGLLLGLASLLVSISVIPESLSQSLNETSLREQSIKQPEKEQNKKQPEKAQTLAKESRQEDVQRIAQFLSYDYQNLEQVRDAISWMRARYVYRSKKKRRVAGMCAEALQVALHRVDLTSRNPVRTDAYKMGAFLNSEGFIDLMREPSVGKYLSDDSIDLEKRLSVLPKGSIMVFSGGTKKICWNRQLKKRVYCGHVAMKVSDPGSYVEISDHMRTSPPPKRRIVHVFVKPPNFTDPTYLLSSNF